ncbi:hypothetical protein GY45DRAFT_929660 [Cubamyces sp. BRFM 1775]|nr:hypothetical protein GY45DRAFT_929660 [Cubamyces sp. BRFM 1775]
MAALLANGWVGENSGPMTFIIVFGIIFCLSECLPPSPLPGPDLHHGCARDPPSLPSKYHRDVPIHAHIICASPVHRPGGVVLHRQVLAVPPARGWAPACSRHGWRRPRGRELPDVQSAEVEVRPACASRARRRPQRHRKCYIQTLSLRLVALRWVVHRRCEHSVPRRGCACSRAYGPQRLHRIIANVL